MERLCVTRVWVGLRVSVPMALHEKKVRGWGEGTGGRSESTTCRTSRKRERAREASVSLHEMLGQSSGSHREKEVGH